MAAFLQVELSLQVVSFRVVLRRQAGLGFQ
jgi:hypothetical protein